MLEGAQSCVYHAYMPLCVCILFGYLVVCCVTLMYVGLLIYTFARQSVRWWDGPWCDAHVGQWLLCAAVMNCSDRAFPDNTAACSGINDVSLKTNQHQPIQKRCTCTCQSNAVHGAAASAAIVANACIFQLSVLCTSHFCYIQSGVHGHCLQQQPVCCHKPTRDWWPVH